MGTTIKDVLEAIRVAHEKAIRCDMATAARSALLPRTSADVELLLLELARAERDCVGHCARFPRDPARPDTTYATTAEGGDDASEADWRRCCGARDRAIRAITVYGLAILDGRRAAPAAADAAEVIS